MLNRYAINITCRRVVQRFYLFTLAGSYAGRSRPRCARGHGHSPVSYTHLTLPTKA